MANIDLEKYKAVWKNERSFDEKKLSQTQIYEFTTSVSKNIVTLYKKGMVFDIVYKLTLLIALVILVFLTVDQTSSLYVNLFIIALTITGIVWQITILNKIPNKNQADKNFLDILRSYIGFYYKYYITSIFVAALSNAIFFLIGSFYYLFFKYQQIPYFDIDDIIVMGIGLVLSYGIGVLVQIKQNKFHVNQLEKCLNEIEESTITEHRIETYRIKRNRNIFLISIVLLVGLFLLIFLTYQLYN
ncbi:MAG: hypothetical protein GY931_15555 [Maribacter sp.]|nr:hypothetical protein [Maribacter sp.]